MPTRVRRRTASLFDPLAQGDRHIVKKGETLSGIALDYGVTVDALVEVNGLKSADAIRIDQELVIPK